MSAIDVLLTRLEGASARGDGRWVAQCPAHEDRCPSLSIREIEDRVLVRCWAGCSALEVVGALGLTLADLFERPAAEGIGAAPARISPFTPEVLRRVRFHLTVLLLAAADIRRGKALSDADQRTVDRAFHELGRSIDELAAFERRDRRNVSCSPSLGTTR